MSTDYFDPSGMHVYEAQVGPKVDFKVDGYNISFYDGAMTLDLTKFQKDYTLNLPISLDYDNCVTTGNSKKMWAMLTLPAKQYITTPVENNTSEIPYYTKTLIPMDMRAVKLVLYRK